MGAAAVVELICCRIWKVNSRNSKQSKTSHPIWSSDSTIVKLGCVQDCRRPAASPGTTAEAFRCSPPSDCLLSLSVSSCGNRRSCEVPVTERVFGEYPCKEQTRYLEVSYTCATPTPPPPPPPPPTKPDCTYTCHWHRPDTFPSP